MGKILSLKKLLKLLSSKYSSKKKVLITGCFDILHQAHKEFLKAAKDQGELVIIGLESDTRVKKLKGGDRPINSFNKRAKALALLNQPDFIFPLPKNFNNKKSHRQLLQLIKPDILAVSENTPFLKKKKDLVKKRKRKLFIFPHNSKYSTTKLLTK